MIEGMPSGKEPSDLDVEPLNVSSGGGSAGGAPAAVPAALLRAYRIDEILGSGAMGVVYLATHRALSRTVAIKLPILTQAAVVERFVREGRILAGLQHTNLVRVFDAGDESGRPYIVLEFVRGCTLSALGHGRRLPVELAVALVVQLLDGLGHAHSCRVLHRDVKSDNALVTGEGVLKLADFGLARSESAPNLTRSGMILGTPAYMSPEQARGDPLDARSDLYSSAVVLFELISGQLPFSSDRVLDLLEMQIRDSPPPLEQLVRAVPGTVAQAVARGLAKDPEQRFATAPDFAHDLRQAVGERALESATARLPALVAGAGAAAQVVAGTTFLQGSAARSHRSATSSPARRTAQQDDASTRRPFVPALGPDRRQPGRTASPVKQPSTASTVSDSPRTNLRGRLGGLLALGLVIAAALASRQQQGSSGPQATRTSPPVVAAAPAKGAIRIVSRPPGARIVRGAGTAAGQPTPATLQGLSPGLHSFTLELAGHARTEITTLVVAGRTQHLSIVLEQRLVPLGRNAFGHEEFRNPKDDSVLIAIPAGSFSMGSNEGGPDEKPVHRVELSPYYIGKHEVMWRQFLAFCEAKQRKAPKRPGWAANRHPVVAVSWEAARAYCEWAGLELPTEAQWEYAARGKEGRKFPWGPQAPDSNGVYRANWSGRADGYAFTAPVCSYGPDALTPRADGSSPVGALDMAGNAWEWCADWYATGYASSATRDPSGPLRPSLAGRVLRGGSWHNYFGASGLRGSFRGWGSPSDADVDNSFRVARPFP
ncbi:MAG: SUMF1/EgtB/PvdO family nonheme iron enzyme [Candidatus Riflebacteria bacterium]|nr:SUMF1/EgtB/PvdO family nonheme iron enzyme [Candidatus Riflebacteria bacterium]